MGTVNTGLGQKAESIFTNLGYAVTPHGQEMRAERKWRVVRITLIEEPGLTGVDEIPTPSREDAYRCFITYETHVEALERHLVRTDPDYEWAIIGVTDTDYVVSARE